MSTEVQKEIELEIGHVLSIDVVGYFKLLTTEQTQKLREIVSAESFCRRGQMNNFFGELKRRTTPLAIPTREDPCFQPLLTKYAASTRGSSL